jgi:hypothetical protein
MIVELTPEAVEMLLSLALGFAFAGLSASTFEVMTDRRASFRLLEAGGPAAVACVPLVVFCAPFIILRNTVRGRRYEHRNFFFVMVATIIAGGWSMLSGRVVLDLAHWLVA